MSEILNWELPFLKGALELGVQFRIGRMEPDELEAIKRLEGLLRRLYR